MYRILTIPKKLGQAHFDFIDSIFGDAIISSIFLYICKFLMINHYTI